MVILKKRLNVLALGLALLAFASPSYAQAAGYNISAARAAATHKCYATTNVDDIRRHAAELAALAPDVILAYGAVVCCSA